MLQSVFSAFARYSRRARLAISTPSSLSRSSSFLASSSLRFQIASIAPLAASGRSPRDFISFSSSDSSSFSASSSISSAASTLTSSGSGSGSSPDADRKAARASPTGIMSEYASRSFIAAMTAFLASSGISIFRRLSSFSTASLCPSAFSTSTRISSIWSLRDFMIGNRFFMFAPASTKDTSSVLTSLSAVIRRLLIGLLRFVL